jgi:hypothetical protein
VKECYIVRIFPEKILLPPPFSYFFGSLQKNPLQVLCFLFSLVVFTFVVVLLNGFPALPAVYSSSARRCGCPECVVISE